MAAKQFQRKRKKEGFLEKFHRAGKKENCKEAHLA